MSLNLLFNMLRELNRTLGNTISCKAGSCCKTTVVTGLYFPPFLLKWHNYFLWINLPLRIFLRYWASYTSCRMSTNKVKCSYIINLFYIYILKFKTSQFNSCRSLHILSLNSPKFWLDPLCFYICPHRIIIDLVSTKCMRVG